MYSKTVETIDKLKMQRIEVATVDLGRAVVCAVMALVDSEAGFEQRLREVLPTVAVRRAIINAGIRTFSGLAFASETPQNLRPMMCFAILQMAFCRVATTWPPTAHFAGFILKLRL